MEIIKVSPGNFKKTVEMSAIAIKEGKVLVCPTDTVYGLLADATNEKAIEKLFKIKKRPKEKPIPIFVKDIKIAKQFAKISEGQEKFLKKIWPGKVTAVLKRKNKLPKILFGNKRTIGLRIPNYKLVNDLLEKSNFPLTGTSANISGNSPSTKIQEVIRQFKDKKGPAFTGGRRVGGVQPDLILDAGNLESSLPSTVIDLTKKPPKILREGAEKTKVKKLIKSKSL